MTTSPEPLSPIETSSAYEFGPFSFDPHGQILLLGGEEVPLPPKAGAVLLCLLESPGRLVHKDELMARVWEGQIVGDTSLSQMISLLRQALGDSARQPLYVQTLHRRGYRFIGTVRRAPQRAVIAPSASLTEVRPMPRGEPAELRGEAAANPWQPWLIGFFAAAAGALLGSAALLYSGRPVPKNDELLLLLSVAADQPISGHAGFDLSPDGRTIVYSSSVDGRKGLWRRDLGSAISVPIAGGEDAFLPAFTPDGRRVVFQSEGGVASVPLAGGSRELLIANQSLWGVVPLSDGSVLFTRVPWGGIWHSAPGAEPQRVTSPDHARGDIHHQVTVVLPGERHALFTIWRVVPEAAAIGVVDLESRDWQVLLEGSFQPRFAPSGELLFMRGQDLMAAGFDPVGMRLLSEPRRIDLPVAIDPLFGVASYAVSSDHLIFVEGVRDADRQRLVRLDREGTPSDTAVTDRRRRTLAVSSDGRQIASSVREGSSADLWLSDLETGNERRLTFDEITTYPLWTLDGSAVVYSSNADGPFNLYLRPVDGRAPARRLWPRDTLQIASSWTPDGRVLVFAEQSEATGFDLWTLDLSVDPPVAKSLLASAADELFGALSPDGSLLAYGSTETGSHQIFVRPYPEVQTAQWQLSETGGVTPFWRPDGSAVVWLSSGGAVSAAALLEGPTVRFAPTEQLFELPSALRIHTLGDTLVAYLPSVPLDPKREHLQVAVHWRRLLQPP